MKTYRHNRSNTRLTSYDMGHIVPTLAKHCIQGTKLIGGVNAAIQLDTMVHQALTQVRVDTWAISGADRILWDDAEAFYTGGDDGKTRPEVPYIKAPANGGWKVGSLADHLGFATGIPNLKCNALPFRLYAMWWNENCRDDQLQERLPISTASGEDTITNTELQRINWSKDMFTTARPEPTLGEDVVIPLASSAPVIGNDMAIGLMDGKGNFGALTTSNGANTTGAAYGRTDGYGKTLPYTTDAGRFGMENVLGLTTDPNKSGMIADLSSSTGILPDDFNFAMARSRWKSRRNLFGTAYKDLLAFLGVRYSDRRLQLPSTLSHGRSMVDISAVLQTAPGTTSQVGDIAGRGLGFASCKYKTYFEEWTTVIHLICVRPATLYVNMQPEEWSWQVREDIFTPEFAHVGMAEIKKGVLFPTGTATDEERWAFANRYDYQRTGFNDVSGKMKTTGSSYHQGRIFETAPSLNGDFLTCMPSGRIFGVTDAEKHDEIEACAVRNTFIEKNIVTPDGNPHYN